MIWGCRFDILSVPIKDVEMFLYPVLSAVKESN